MLSAEGFRFLILPVQLTQFPMARCKIWTGLWTGLDCYFRAVIFLEGGGAGGAVLFFLVCKKITFSTFPQQAIFFPLGGGGGGREVVLYRLYSSLLFVGFVLCLSFLVWVGA